MKEYIPWWDSETACEYYRDEGITVACLDNWLFAAEDGEDYSDKGGIDFVLIARKPCLLVGTSAQWLEQTRHAFRGPYSGGWLALGKIDESLGGIHLVWQQESREEGYLFED